MQLEENILRLLEPMLVDAIDRPVVFAHGSHPLPYALIQANIFFIVYLFKSRVPVARAGNL